MEDWQIDYLKSALDTRMLLWMPDDETVLTIHHIGTHAEEGDDSPCAISKSGKYIALYNCEFNQFVLATRLP